MSYSLPFWKRSWIIKVWRYFYSDKVIPLLSYIGFSRLFFKYRTKVWDIWHGYRISLKFSWCTLKIVNFSMYGKNKFYLIPTTKQILFKYSIFCEDKCLNLSLPEDDFLEWILSNLFKIIRSLYEFSIKSISRY